MIESPRHHFEFSCRSFAATAAAVVAAHSQYGFDPHDDSDNLRIHNNVVYDNGELVVPISPPFGHPTRYLARGGRIFATLVEGLVSVARVAARASKRWQNPKTLPANAFRPILARFTGHVCMGMWINKLHMKASMAHT